MNFKKKYESLNIFQIKEFIPHIIINKDKGIINVLRRHVVNLKSIKYGLTEELFCLSEQEVEVIKKMVPNIFDKENKKITKDNILDKNILKEKMKAIKELIVDCNSVITDNLGVGILHDNCIQNENDFINLPLATDKNKFGVFLSTINKTLFEAIKTNGKRKGDNNYFWITFKNNYPSLQCVIDKVRVYRNKTSHWKLDASNETKYNEYLEEDLDGYMPELIKDGYLNLQFIIVSSLEKTLRDIMNISS